MSSPPQLMLDVEMKETKASGRSEGGRVGKRNGDICEAKRSTERHSITTVPRRLYSTAVYMNVDIIREREGGGGKGSR